MIVLWLLATLAHGQTAFESETIAQVRHDLFGQPVLPVNQYLRLTDRGRPVDIDAYVAASWPSGLDGRLDPDLFLLRVGKEADWGGWSVGRQQALSVLRPQTFDGARLVLQPSERLDLSAWGGVARHHDLDDLTEGVGMGRAEMKYHADSAVVRAGVEVLWDEGLLAQEDVEALYFVRNLRALPEARALVVRSGEELQWAKLQLGASLVSGVRATVHAQRRRVDDPKALLGESLVSAFAPGGVDEVGVGLRVSNRSWSAFSGSYALARYEQLGEPMYGHAAEASYAPGPLDARLRLLPGWRFRSGPGGMFHAAHLTAMLVATDEVSLQGRVALVPYRKLDHPWATATAAGVEGTFGLTRNIAVRTSLDAASDAVYTFDLRGGAAVVLGYR